MAIYVTKHYYVCMPTGIELIYILDKKHFNYHKLWFPILVLWIFSFKVYNSDWIMPSFGKTLFSSTFNQ